ncbi:MAG: FHS family L-fucose permease-like MFS transporter, partial [Algoriphagus sp.]
MTDNRSKNNLIPMLIIGAMFFIFGFVTWINGVLIPFMKTINELSDTQAYLVATASYVAFVVMALPSSYLLKKVGYKKGMSIGLMIMAVGALVFIPAAEARTYWMFLAGIFIQGTGMTL